MCSVGTCTTARSQTGDRLRRQPFTLPASPGPRSTARCRVRGRLCSGVVLRRWCARSAGIGTLSEIGFSVFGTMVPTRDDFVALNPERAITRAANLLISLKHTPAAIQTLERARDELLLILARTGDHSSVRGRSSLRATRSTTVGPAGCTRRRATAWWTGSRVWGAQRGAGRFVGVHDGPEESVLTAMTLAARRPTAWPGSARRRPQPSALHRSATESAASCDRGAQTVGDR
jgi:hypothetical protein